MTFAIGVKTVLEIRSGEIDRRDCSLREVREDQNVCLHAYDGENAPLFPKTEMSAISDLFVIDRSGTCILLLDSASSLLSCRH